MFPTPGHDSPLLRTAPGKLERHHHCFLPFRTRDFRVKAVRRCDFAHARPQALFPYRQLGTKELDVLPARPAISRHPAGGFPLPGAAMRAFDFDFINQRSVLRMDAAAVGPLFRLPEGAADFRRRG